MAIGDSERTKERGRGRVEEKRKGIEMIIIIIKKKKKKKKKIEIKKGKKGGKGKIGTKIKLQHFSLFNNKFFTTPSVPIYWSSIPFWNVPK